MTRYLVGRVAEMLVVLLVMSAVVFGLIGLMPGDPVDLMIAGDPKMTSEDAARLRTLYGLDRPLAARYLTWLGSALGGDLGHSRSFSRPVLERFSTSLRPSMGTSTACAAAPTPRTTSAAAASDLRAPPIMLARSRTAQPGDSHAR